MNERMTDDNYMERMKEGYEKIPGYLTDMGNEAGALIGSIPEGAKMTHAADSIYYMCLSTGRDIPATADDLRETISDYIEHEGHARLAGFRVANHALACRLGIVREENVWKTLGIFTD